MFYKCYAAKLGIVSDVTLFVMYNHNNESIPKTSQCTTLDNKCTTINNILKIRLVTESEMLLIHGSLVKSVVEPVTS